VDGYLNLAVKVHQYIKENIVSLTVSKLAREIFLTERTMRRWFHRCYGMSAKFFLKLSRIEQPFKNMEHNPKMSLPEVAIKMGYYDQSHFQNEMRYSQI
jgi:methylphosphotriester-DNA--protein-cysteine methyltransferase